MTPKDDTHRLAATQPEYPDAEKIRAYGALSFLYLRSDYHAHVTLGRARLGLQPPIDLGFYKIFDVEGVPRAGVLWAFLSPEAEAKFLSGTPLAPQDWISGDQMWVIEIIAPYGQRTGAQVMNWLRNSLPTEITRVRYMRTDEAHGKRHIVEVNRRASGRWGVRIVSEDRITKREG